jgi:hypothetical protein
VTTANTSSDNGKHIAMNVGQTNPALRQGGITKNTVTQVVSLAGQSACVCQRTPQEQGELPNIFIHIILADKLTRSMLSQTQFN